MPEAQLNVVRPPAEEASVPAAPAHAPECMKIEVSEDPQTGVLTIGPPEHALRQEHVSIADVRHELGKDRPEVATGRVLDGAPASQSQQLTHQAG